MIKKDDIYYLSDQFGTRFIKVDNIKNDEVFFREKTFLIAHQKDNYCKPLWVNDISLYDLIFKLAECSPPLHWRTHQSGYSQNMNWLHKVKKIKVSYLEKMIDKPRFKSEFRGAIKIELNFLDKLSFLKKEPLDKLLDQKNWSAMIKNHLVARESKTNNVLITQSEKISIDQWRNIVLDELLN